MAGYWSQVRELEKSYGPSAASADGRVIEMGINITIVTVFKIKYNSDYKELVFASKYYEKMDYYNIVEFDIRKGFFGFDILENKKLK